MIPDTDWPAAAPERHPLLNRVHCMDALDLLRVLPANSIDAIVTDPPAGIAFMGKEWDRDKGGRAAWVAWMSDIAREALRVLKPGGHALIACGTRTQHRMAVNVEDGGFEIRDVIAWLYGSGFPKSLDVSKAIDREAGAEREVVGDNPHARPNTDGVYDAKYGTKGHDPYITAPATDAARQWDGWGTALKPAMELFTLARKPVASTVAANVQAWGTGALNVDACRVGTDGEHLGGNRNNSHTNYSGEVYGKFAEQYAKPSHPAGRFPANVCHDGSDEVTRLFPVTSSGVGAIRKNKPGLFGLGGDGQANTEYGDTGSAARFFYTAKASQEERNAGLDGFEIIPPGEVTGGRTEGSAGLNSPRAGAGRTSGSKNHHPTVKPIALMRYLCRLITPPGGIVLDMFAGSGTTGLAAREEGFRFILCDLSPEYVAIARARLAQPYTLPMFDSAA